MATREQPLFVADARVRSLAEQLDGMQDADAKEKALIAYLQQTVEDLEAGRIQTTVSAATLSPDNDVEPLPSVGESDTNQSPDDAFDLARKHGLESVFIAWVMNRSLQVAENPLERLPCANTRPEEDWRCKKEGEMVCGQCRLVSYCSKVGCHIVCRSVFYPRW